MKLGFFSLTVMAIAMVAIAIPAGADYTPPGWKVQFTIDGCDGYVEVGGHDFGSGYHVYGITGPVSASLSGGFGSKIYAGANTQFVEVLEIRPTTNEAYRLSWMTYEWYSADLWWPQLLVDYSALGMLSFPIDLSQPGSIMLTGDYNVVIYGNRPIPEPSSFFALGTGIVGLLGYGLRRRH